MSDEKVIAYAKLQGEDTAWYVKDLPFFFGRETDKSPEAFLNICMDKKDKTVSREFAVLHYSEEKKCYALDVKGKKGCHVNKVFYGKDQTCYLKDGDAVSMDKKDELKEKNRQNEKRFEREEENTSKRREVEKQ